MNFNVWLLPWHFEPPFVSEDLLARKAFILAKVKDSELVMGGENKIFPALLDIYNLITGQTTLLT